MSVVHTASYQIGAADSGGAKPFFGPLDRASMLAMGSNEPRNSRHLISEKDQEMNVGCVDYQAPKALFGANRNSQLPPLQLGWTSVADDEEIMTHLSPLQPSNCQCLG